MKQRDADVVIFGAGGLGRMVQDYPAAVRCWRPAAYLDSGSASTAAGGGPAGYGRYATGRVITAGRSDAGRSGYRPQSDGSPSPANLRAASSQVRHSPLVSISPTAFVGDHVIIGPRVSICVHARIGAHTVVSAGSIIEHDNFIGRGVFCIRPFG